MSGEKSGVRVCFNVDRILVDLSRLKRLLEILWIRERALERQRSWDRQLDLRPDVWSAGDFEQPADSRRSFPHARQAPVALTPGIEYLGINSASVIADPHAQVTVRVFEL